ncbi:hypothetical protein QE152_g33102 [Popillia japonica]|uniref:Uncharacterized protein n=1 Tax=Popillia japonica TaxID=7064 RepID=A0AAW1IYJ8_POPJA
MAVAGLMCRSRFILRIEIFKGLRYSTIVNSVQLNEFPQLKKLRHCRRFTTNFSISDKSKTDVAKLESSSCSSDSDSEDEGKSCSKSR